MVTLDYVYSLYRILLGREPESEDAVRQHLAANDEREILRKFLKSREFLSKEWLLIGRHLSADAQPVAVTASSEQLHAMLAGIAEKWQQYGKSEPYWSVIVSEDYKTTNITENIDRFYATGVDDVDLALRAVSRAGIDPSGFRAAIDFGCGVGRLTLALANRIGTVTGVDISPGHVALARKRAQAHGANNVSFEIISSVADILAIDKADFIMSLIVIQHNPPPVMAEIFRMLLDRLNVNGVAYIQIPTFIENYSFDVGKYLEGEKDDMEMNCLPQHHIFQLINDAGCVPLEIREDSCLY